MAQGRLQRRSVDPLPRRAVARPLRTLCPTDDCGMESGPMNEFGEPNMGNPSVRFDEGRERVGHWPFGLSTQPLLPTLRPRPACTTACTLCGLILMFGVATRSL